MFLFLKLLLLMLRPLIWIIIFFMIAWFSKNKKRKSLLFKTGCVLLLFFTNPFIINRIIGAYETKPLQLQPGAQYNAGIVLGGFVAYNEEENQGYFNQVSDRFIETALLYKQGHIRKIIVAAGNGYMTENNFEEANFVKNALVMLGIPAEVIYTDTTSRNTLENANNTKAIIEAQHMQGPFLLISSALHLPRAQLVFRKKDLNVILYPCDFNSTSVQNNILVDDIWPSAEALEHWDRFIKEMAGILTYKITGKG